MQEKTRPETLKKHTHRTFGRTSSRLSSADLAKLEKRLAPYAFMEADLQRFPQAELEVGMGNGIALFERAKKSPETLFMGCEVYQNGLRSLVNALEIAENEGAPLQNIRIIPTDARDFMKTLPPQSLHRICLLYPDPWPKTKHHARRIFNPDFLAESARLLTENGELFCATDIPDYALSMLATAYKNALFTPTAINPQEWATPPAWWASTKYEAKAKREGRHPFYFLFKTAVEKINHNLHTKA